jgi:hypothetical protein
MRGEENWCVLKKHREGQQREERFCGIKRKSEEVKGERWARMKKNYSEVDFWIF